MQSRTAVLLLILACMPASSLLAADKVSLQPKYPPGKYLQTMDMNMSIESVKGDMPISSQMAMTMESILEIGTPDAAGARKLQISIRRVKMHGGPSKGPLMEFDSALPSNKLNPSFAAAMAKVMNAKASGVLQPDGKITDVVGAEAFSQMMTPAGMAATDLGKSIFTQFTEMLPTSPVAVGEKWTKTISREMPVVGKMDNTYECALKSVEGPLAMVSYTGKVRARPQTSASAPTSGPAMPHLESMDLQTVGEVTFNTEIGMYQSGKTQSDATTVMVGNMGGKGMRIEMKQKSDALITIRPATAEDLKPIVPVTQPGASGPSTDKDAPTSQPSF